MPQSDCFRTEVREILKENVRWITAYGYSEPTAETIADAFSFSLADCFVPSALNSRFAIVQSKALIFQQGKNILTIYLDLQTLTSPALLQKQKLPLQSTSAYLRFTDTQNGVNFSDVFVEDLRSLRKVLDLYSGTVCLYLDDYSLYHQLDPFCGRKIFFRADVPWDLLKTELAAHGIRGGRLFLQRYSDSVLFLFLFDPLGNVIFSMLPAWELAKIKAAVQKGEYSLCGDCPSSLYGSLGWQSFRDVMAATTEDSQFGKLRCADFSSLRVL